MGELTERQKAIATAVVAEHIQTAQPVGSDALRASHGFSCSSATIRNDMVRLERAGYLDQPHTSAGRTPLGPAYRLYVDRLRVGSGHLDRDTAWIQGELRRVAGQPEAAVRLSSGILARVTRYPAIVVAPSESEKRLVDLSLTPVSARTVLLSFLDCSGRSEEALLESDAPVTAAEIDRIEALLRARLLGEDLGAAPPLSEDDVPDAGLLAGLRRALEDAGGGHVHVEGTTFILDQPEFEEVQRLRRVIGALTQSALLRQALSTAAGSEKPAARIGPEHGIEVLRDCSVVAASYATADSEGAIGVLGPMRMHYDVALQMVATIARHLGQALSRSRRQ
ncbi:MAG: heat-inducible transcriptional repressor HrcA [Armatimonadota bacterium]